MTRWAFGPALRVATGVEPLLASWNRSEDPAQVRLRRYLATMAEAVGLSALPATGLFLSMDVDVVRPLRLERGCDLENYLTPLVGHLGWSRFVLARAAKRVGGGSSVSVGLAIPVGDGPAREWPGLTARVVSAGPAKHVFRQALLDASVEPIPGGPVEVDLGFKVSSARNWVSLWKPAGDAMGPVLGEPNPLKPYHLSDDRIVELTLHRDIEESLGYAFEVDFRWRLAP